MSGYLGSLRFRIVAVVCVALLPSLAMIILSGMRQRADITKDMQEKTLSLVKQASREQLLMVENTRTLLKALSGRPEAITGDVPACERLFAQIMKLGPRYDNLGLIGADGYVRVSVHPISTPIFFGDRPHVQAAMQTLDFSMSKLQMSRIMRKPTLVCNYPVLDSSGKLLGVLFANLSLSWLEELFAEARLPVGAALTLIGEDGTVLARWPDPEQWVGKNLTGAGLFQAMREKEEVTTTAPGVDGMMRVYSFGPVGRDRILGYAYAGIPVAFAEDATNRALWRNAAGVGITLGLAVVLAGIVGMVFVTRPLKSLVSTMEGLAQGNLDARSGFRAGPQEFGDLATTFDRMARSLKEREDQRKQAEEALRESEARLRLALEATKDGIWDWNMLTGEVHRSFNFFGMLGYTEDEFPQGFEGWASLVHPDDLDKTRLILEEYVTGKRDAYETEFRMLAKSGEFRWILSRGQIVERDSLGNGIRMVGSHTDITDRMKALDALEQSETRYRALFENMSNCVAIYEAKDNGEDFVFLGFNEAAERKEQISRDQVIGRSVLEVFPGVKDFGLIDVFQRVWSTGLPEHYPVALYKDERIAGWRENFVYRLPSGEVVAVYSDETERKKAEEALREAQRRERDIMNHSPALISIKDLEGTVIFVNRRFEVLDGPSPEEFVGKNVFDLFPKEIADQLWANDVAALRADKPLQSEESVYHKDGELHTYLTVKFPLKNEEGVAYGICAISTDITDRKEAENEINKLNAELEQRVRDRTAELETANKELESFSYSVSHDLRAPLRAINGFAEIIARRHRASLNQEGQRYFDYIVEGSAQMGRLIDDLLRYSRLGRRALRLGTVSPLDVLSAVMKTLAGRIAETNAQVAIPQAIPRVRGDRTLIEQIFTNLFENALMYRSAEAPLRVEIRGTVTDDHVVIEVSDNGIGIQPEYHEKIFNMFQRLHGYDEYPGTGVGLAIVRKAAKLMDGDIWVESDVGQGSRFFVKLHLSKED